MSQIRARPGRQIIHVVRATGVTTPGIINSINADDTVNLTLYVNAAAGTSLLANVPLADISFSAGPQSV